MIKTSAKQNHLESDFLFKVIYFKNMTVIGIISESQVLSLIDVPVHFDLLQSISCRSEAIALDQ